MLPVRGVGEKSTNLQLLRFAAAIAVLFCHAFSIADGSIDREWLYQCTHGQLDFGVLAVTLFFFIGGYLIARSVQRHQTAGRFFLARGKRLFPALAFVTVCTILLGSVFSAWGPKAYFLSVDTWKYLLNSLLIPVHDLPGVFLAHPYGRTVNGSLWTLPVEAACYVGCFAAYKLGWMKRTVFKYWFALACLGWVVLHYGLRSFMGLALVLYPCVFFAAGMAYYIYREKIRVRPAYLLGMIALFVISCMAGIGRVGLLILWPYVIYSVCFKMRQVGSTAARPGDFSYGMYLWGFPVQQALVDRWGGMSPYVNFAAALPIVILLGALTYYLVERNI